MEEKIREDEAPMYLEAGRALMEAQNLEMFLSSLIAIQQSRFPKSTNVPRLSDLYAEHDRKTLGRLLKDVKKHVNLDSDFEKDLQQALNYRNLLVHRYFREATERYGYSEAKRLAPLELRKITMFLNEMTKSVISITFGYATKLGLTPEILNDELKKAGADFTVDWPSN
jgi:hypothetical protein